MNNDELRNALDEVNNKLTTILSTLGVITWSVTLQFQACENDFETCLPGAIDGVYQSLNTLLGEYQSMAFKIDKILKEGATNGKE